VIGEVLCFIQEVSREDERSPSSFREKDIPDTATRKWIESSGYFIDAADTAPANQHHDQLELPFLSS
jgi:hypothetical protein